MDTFPERYDSRFATGKGQGSMGRLMAIEGRKNAQDAKRGKVFTKIIREITTAARSCCSPITR